jgi:molybdopterin-guanine dinucleotide biosynthesis protein A
MTALPVGAYCAGVDQARATPWPTGCTLIVLTGGASRRLGRDKATVHVGGRRLVDRLLADVPEYVPVVVVGPVLDGLARRVAFVREEPSGSGPLAGIGAGMAAVGTPLVGVIAADMPFAVPVVAGALWRVRAATSQASGVTGRAGTGSAGAGTGIDHRDDAGRDTGHGDTAHGDTALGDAAHGDTVHGGWSQRELVRGDPAERGVVQAVVPVDPEGRRQPLCAAYWTDALRQALADLGPLADLPVRALLPGLDVMEWPVPAAALADVDTREQLEVARTRAAEEGRDMQEWVDAVRAALGVDVALDIDAVLDVARDAAHTVDRPAAPVTTYLLGAAVAAGADPADAAARIGELARGWATRSQ